MRALVIGLVLVVVVLGFELNLAHTKIAQETEKSRLLADLTAQRDRLLADLDTMEQKYHWAMRAELELRRSCQ